MDNDKIKDIEDVGFFNFVFDMSDDSKSEIINILQYALLSIIPIVLLNKSIHYLISEADESKGNFELLGEIVAQVVLMFMGIYFIHKMLVYIPTFSKRNYTPLNLTNLILAFMMILLSLQSKLGQKANIIVERLLEMWYGKSKFPLKEGMSNNSVPLNPASVGGQPPPMHHPSQSDRMESGGMPPIGQMIPQNSSPGMQQMPGGQDSGNFDTMFAGPNVPLQDANAPGGMFEPVAANSFGGGSAF